MQFWKGKGQRHKTSLREGTKGRQFLEGDAFLCIKKACENETASSI